MQNNTAMTVNGKEVAIREEYRKDYAIVTAYTYKGVDVDVHVSVIPSSNGQFGKVFFTVSAMVVDNGEYLFPSEYDGEELTESQAFTAARNILKEFVR